MKPWSVAICSMLALPCQAWAWQQPAPETPPPGPLPEVAWDTGAPPAFIRSVAFTEGTTKRPVSARRRRPDLGPVYVWTGTPLWLAVEVDPGSTGALLLCVEWPKPDPQKPPPRECRRMPAGPGTLRFAAPDTSGWPEDRYVVRLSTLASCPAGTTCMTLPRPLGVVGYAVGDRPPAAANGHGHAPSAPAFPWPPPRPTVRTVLARDAAFANAARLGAVAARLADALAAAGYESPAFYSAPGGYAMVARLEQIEADGTPKPVPMRWSAALPQREVFSLADYFSALFSAPEGHYRVVVFIVSDQPFATSASGASREQAAAWLDGGLNVLPDAIAALPLTARHACTALIYQFRRQGFQGEAISVHDGAPEASVQLRRTRILDEHGHLNR